MSVANPRSGTAAVYFDPSGPAVSLAGTMSVAANDGTFAVYFNPSQPYVGGIRDSIAVHILSTGGTINVSGVVSGTVSVSAKDGTMAVYFSPSQPAINQGTSPWLVSDQPSTTTGWLTANFTSGDGSTALTNTAQVIKSSAGALGGWYIYNPNTVAAWLILYNTAAASVTVGTTAPKMVIGIPAGSAANVEFSKGIPFTNAGWSAAAVMTSAAGNTAPTTALDVMIMYI